MSRRAAPIARFLLALAAAAAGTAARADAPAVIAPLQVEPDRNNVNLHDGKTRIEMPVLSVPAAPNLQFDRLQNAAPYFTARVYTAPSDDHDSRSYAIHIGAESSDAIDCYDNECTSVTGSGAILDWRHRKYLQAGSGVLWEFNSQAVHSPAPNEALTFYGTTATYPNGEVIGFEYDTAAPNLPFNRVLHRPRKLSSSLGYYITITYADSSDPLSSDWSRVTQAALYRDGATPTLLRRFTYGSTIRDHGAGTSDDGRDYVCTGCVNALGVDIEVSAGSMQLPADGTPVPPVPPTVQVTPLDSGAYPVVGAVTRDGVGWSYSYANLHLQPGTSRWLFDHLTVTGPNSFQQVYDVSNAYRSVYDQATNRIHTTISRVTSRLSDTVTRSTSYYYDFYDRPTRIVYPELNEVGVVYDGYANITSRTSTPKPNSGLSPITEYANFPIATCAPDDKPTILCWRPTWSRDGMQRQTDYAYNALGQQTEQIDPADNDGVRRRTSTLYATSPPIYATSPGISRRSAVRICADTGASCGTSAPIQTEYDYGVSGPVLLPVAERRIDVAQGVTLTTNYSYDAAGRLLSVDGPLAGTDDTTYNRYDVYGRRTWEIGARADSGLRIATRSTYRDSDDKPVSTETGTIPDANSTTLSVFRRTDLTYDSRRNPVREAVSAAGTTYSVLDRSYDDQGRLECTAVRMNPAAFGAAPGACTLGAQGSDGPDRITRNVYDDAGQRLQLRERVGTADEATEATWAYGSNGEVTTLIDGNGNRAELRYDGHGRQDRWTFPSPNGPVSPPYNDATQATALATAGAVNTGDYEAYGYDAAGNRTSLRTRAGDTLTYQYDNLDRMIAKIVPERSGLTAAQTRDVYYGYDLGNRQLYARFDSAAGPGITNSYDGFGRLGSTSANTDGISRTLSYLYDAAGGRTRITHPGGVAFSTLRDALDRPFWLDSADPAYGRYYSSYRPDGLPAGQSRGNGASTWTSRDPIQRLNGLGHYYGGSGASDVLWLYAHNPASQIRSVSRDNDAYAWTGHYAVARAYTANGLNQYSAVASSTGSGQSSASFTYDLNGNLISDGTRSYTYDVENRLVSMSNGAALSYDPLGRLYQVTLGANTTRFLYDGDALVAEYDGAGAITARYVHWDGADVPIISYTATGAALTSPTYLHPDHQGSIVAISGAAGSVQINRYDEYGIPAATNTGRFQYTGQAWLPELGLYYYKARLYSPTLGRFMQTDPVGYQGGINLYAYVGNDPINHNDPAGTHGRGTGWTDNKRWRAYDRAQQAAATRMERRVQRINRALERGGGALQAEQRRFTRTFGNGSATEANMRGVASTLAGTAAMLRDDGSNGYFANGLSADNFSAPDIFARSEIGGKTISVNIDHPDLGTHGDAGRAWSSAGHEGTHNFGLDDVRVNGVAAYRYGNEAERNLYNNLRTTNPAATLGNPDHLMQYIED